MSYTPPAGNAIHIVFASSTYTPPAGSAIHIVFGAQSNTIFVSAINDGAFGAPTVYNYSSFALPSGIPAGDIGSHSVTSQAHVAPSGFDDEGIGTPDVLSPSGIIAPSGFVDDVFGDPTITARATVAPSGFTDEGIGTPAVLNLNRFILLDDDPDTPLVIEHFGIPPGSVGAPSVRNQREIIQPIGQVFVAFGTALVYNLIQEVRPVGFDSFTGFGMPGGGHVDLFRRHIVPTIIDQSAIGAHMVSNFEREVDVLPGLDATLFGTADVEFKNREVFPLFVQSGGYGRPVVDQTHFVTTAGAGDQSAFGNHHVHDNRQFPEIQGFEATQWGIPRLSYNPQPVAPAGFWGANPDTIPSQQWGRPTVINRNQYVQQLFSVTPSDGGVFGSPIWTLVENRNRTVGPVGWNSSKVSTHALIELGARAVVPPGIDGPTFGGGTFAAYRIRTIPLDGLEPGEISHWTQVYNAARVVLGGAGDQSAIGTASVINTRRYFPFISGGDQSAIGTAFVDFRVRTVTPYFSYGGGIFGNNSPYLYTQYAAPTGMDPGGAGGQWGLAFVELHRNQVFPRFPSGEAFGDASVINRNRYLTHGGGAEQTLFGRPTVFNKIQYVQPVGSLFTNYGLYAAGYRTRTITLFGINSQLISTHAQVTNVIPDPPPSGTVFPSGFQDDAFGTTAVRTNIIRPAGDVWTSFGLPFVHANSVYPQSFGELDDLLRIGVPKVIGPQYVNVNSGGIAPPAASKPRINPYTIYCTFDVTDQAIENNGNRWTYMDHNMSAPGDDPAARPFFGTPTVTHHTRFVNVGGYVNTSYGTPKAELLRRYVLPTGFRATKWGSPMLNATQEAEPLSFQDDVFGTTDVSHYIDPTIPRHVNPSGFAERFGSHHIDLFNRELLVQGIDSFTMSAPVPYDSRFYGPLSNRVHFPEPIIAGAGDTSLFGTHWVSLRIRNVYPEGWDSFVSDYEIDEFNLRMRITRKNHVGIVAGIPPTGGVGTPTVSQQLRTVGPEPANRVTAFGNPDVRFQSIVALGGLGFDSLVFGDVTKWQDGDPVQPYGSLMEAMGIPRIDRRVIGSGFVAGGLGEPALGGHILPPGFDASVFGVPTLTHADGTDFVCGQAPRAIPPQGFAVGAIGTADVVHG